MHIVARDNFELISHTEYIDLERLHNDRNRCAHPSLQISGEPYQPTAELARYHIRNAVTHFLQQLPVQGKAAQNLIWNDIESEIFPTDIELAKSIFKKGLLARARLSLIRGMIVGLTKDLLKQNLTIKQRLQRFCALKAILEIHVAQGEKVLFEDLPSIINHLDDSFWPNVLTYVRNVPISWDAMGDLGRIKANTFITTAPIDRVAPILKDAFQIPALKASAHKRTFDFSAGALAEQIKINPLPEYVEAAIALFAGAENFRSSDFSSRSLLLPLIPLFSADQVNKIIDAYKENNQLYWNGNVDNVMEKIFIETNHYADATKPAWLDAHTKVGIQMSSTLVTLIEKRYL